MELKQHVVYFIPHRARDATADSSRHGGMPTRMQWLVRQGAAACPSERLERLGALRERDAGATRGESREGIDDGLH